MFALIADLWENIRVALDGLLSNKLRSSLTMLGVIIGVGAVIALMSIGAGAQAEITSQINSIGTNLLIVMPMSSGRVMGGGGGGGGSPAYITMDDVEALSNPLNVHNALFVVPEYSTNGQIIFGDTNFSVTALGTRRIYQPE